MVRYAGVSPLNQQSKACPASCLAVLPDAAASGSMSAEIRTFVNRILKEQMSEAVRLVSQNKEKIDALVDKLLAKNHMNRDEIEKILKR